MKKVFFLIYLYFSLPAIHSQNDQPNKTFFRLFAENDALVPSDKATDWGYTSGCRIDLFYSPVKKRTGLFNWFNQLAGTNIVNQSGWGLMQMIIAPQKTSLSLPDKNDYPYAGALFAIHTIHSASEARKMNFQTEWVVGVMGPPSFAKETQTFFHQLIKDPPPMGWDHQLPTDLLLNYNLKAEKCLAGNKSIGLATGGEVFCGTMKDGLSLHLLLQIGNNRDRFSGLINQYFAVKKPKLSLAFRATSEFKFYDALLEGGIFNSQSPLRKSHSKYGSVLQRQKLTGSMDLFLLFSTRKFALSLTQKMTSSEFRGYGSHRIGNISVYKTL